jgi:signal recognition particle subunit SRP54
MLGLGDLQGLLERARKAELRPEIAERVVRADFTLEDFYEQFKALQQMGSLNQLFQMIPGIGAKIPRELVEQQEEKIKAFRYIIDSMTPEERNDPGIMNQSRIKRVAQGSGRSEAEVRELLSQYQRARKLMRQLGGIRALRQGKLKQVLKRFGLRS